MSTIQYVRILSTNVYMRFKDTAPLFPSRLPSSFLCSSEVPGEAYTSVNEADALLILNELKKSCNETVGPEVRALNDSTV